MTLWLALFFLVSLFVCLFLTLYWRITSSLPPPTLVPMCSLSPYIRLCFLDFYINRIIVCPFFFDWLLSLRIIFLRFIHIILCISSSFLLLLSGIPLHGCFTFCLFTCWCTCGFQILAITNKGFMNTHVQVFVYMNTGFYFFWENR